MDITFTPAEPDVIAQLDQTAMDLKAHATALGAFFNELVRAGIDRADATDMVKERQLYDLYGDGCCGRDEGE